MKILRNRIFLSVLCVVLAGAIAFLLLPKLYADKGATIKVLRAGQEITAGTMIQEKHLAYVEVGKFGLPQDIVADKSLIIGKIAQTDIMAGDFFFSQKLGGFIADEKLDRIEKESKRLVTISVLSISAGLSSHLRSGDLVTVAVFLNRNAEGSEGQGTPFHVVIYDELRELEVYSVENSRTQSTSQVREQQAEGQTSSSDPIAKAVTLVVTEEQALKLIEAEYTGKIHLIFLKRGVSIER